MKPYMIPIPEESLIQTALDKIDYHDVFAIKVANKVPVEVLPPLFFKVFPAWFMGLMYLREAIAGLIGLKTGKGIDVKKQLQEFSGQPGESIALFHVLDRSEEEILMGENDSHLDFRLSFFARPVEGGTELVMATTVQFNALLGKVYFVPVRPIHKLIMPIILKRMAKRLKAKALKLNTAD